LRKHQEHLEELVQERTSKLKEEIEERKQAEKALRESEERYRTLVENLPIAVYRNTPGPKGKILVGNPAYYRMFGFDSEEEFKHFSVADFYVSPKERKAFSDNLLANE
jgi:PAS domain-containing protein